MLPISFILAALLAAEGVVLAHPINYARRNEPPSIVLRAVSDNNQPVALTQRHDGQHNYWLGARGYDVDGVEMRGKEKMERRDSDDESTAPMTSTESNGRKSNAVGKSSRFHEVLDDDDEITQNDPDGESHAPAKKVTSPEEPSKGMDQNGSEQGSQAQTAPAEKDNHSTSRRHGVVKKVVVYSKAAVGRMRSVISRVGRPGRVPRKEGDTASV